MNKYVNYKDCKHLICCETFDTEANGSGVVPNMNFTFTKGVKYKCKYVEYNDDFYYMEVINDNVGIAFSSTDDNDVKLIYENFLTLSEHRKTVIDELI